MCLNSSLFKTQNPVSGDLFVTNVETKVLKFPRETNARKERKKMDHFFQEELEGDIFWSEIDPRNRSAFLPYFSRRGSQIRVENSCDGSYTTNMNKRMIEFTRKSWPGKIEAQESEGNRGYRHMMSERTRREREKKGYLTLHAMLPLGTKVSD